MDKPDERVLFRSIPTNLSPVLDRVAGVMERCVNYGTHLLGTCYKSPTKPGGVAPLLLGRQVIEGLDAISVLVRRLCIDPCLLLIRSQIEAGWGLLWMAQAETQRRSDQYDVYTFHARIAMHRKQDLSTEQGKQFLAEWMKDELCRGIPVKPYDSKINIKRLEKQLAQPKFAEVEAEWQRTNKKCNKFYWYTLFDGPKDIQQLARKLGKSGYYEVIYRMASTYAHASDVHRATRSLPDGGGSMVHIRYPIHLVYVSLFAISLTLEAYRTLHTIYLGGKMDEYAKWYRTKLSEDFMWIAKVKLQE